MTTRHLHPLALVQFESHTIRNWIIPFAGIIFSFANDKVPVWAAWGLVILLIAVLIGWPVLRWLTFTYAVEPDALVIHSGVFIKAHEHIPYARIQTIQRQQWFYLKPFHLEDVTIETAGHGDGKGEARLFVVPETTVTAIEAARHGQTSPSTTDPSPESSDQSVDASYQISRHDLLVFAATSLGVVPIAVVLITLWDRIQRLMPEAWLQHFYEDLAHVALMLMIALLTVFFVIALLISFLWTLQKYYHFTLTRRQNQLTATRGLISQNTVTASLDRIQAVRFKQNVLRQLNHLTTVQTLMASKAADDDDDHDLVIMPVIPDQQVFDTMPAFINWLPAQRPALTGVLATHRWLFMRNASFIALVPIGLCLWVFHWWGLVSLLLIPLALALGWYAGHNAGVAVITQDRVAVQTGHLFERTLYIVRRENIQSLEDQQSWFMIRPGLKHLTINVRHGNKNEALQVRYLSATTVATIYQWYTGVTEEELI